MAYNKNINIGPNNVLNISGSLINVQGALSGTEISGTHAQFTSLTASNLEFGNNLYISGGLTVGNYVQLLPVASVVIPTNQTASYIYTSGSTNDMYFTQYQPGSNFNNTTRLRWLESTLSTGLLHGGVLSTVNGTTTFSLTSGSGLIVNYNASTGSDPYPTIQFVNWTASVSQSLTYVTASQISYISVDQHGEILQSPTPPTFAQYKDRIFIGRVLHQSGSVTNGATNTPPTAYGLATSTADLIRAIGPLKIAGHYLAASGSTLGLTKTAGDAYVEGRNYAGNPNIPNIILAADDPSVTVSKIYRQHVSGGNPVINTGIANAGYTEVDPTKYQDANGNLINVGNNNFSVQRVFWFPKAVNRALFVYYGQALYTNLDDAIAGITTENFTEGDNTKGSAILVGFLVMKGNVSNFDTPNTARIYQASTFRGGGAGGGGGSSGGGTTLPAGSSSYVQFNDVGSFGADSRFTFDKISHTLTVTGTGSFGALTTTNITSSGISGSKLELNTGTRTSLNYGAYISGVPYNGPLVRIEPAGNTAHVGISGSLNNGGLQVVFGSGYVGTGVTFAGDFENSNQSTGNDLKFDTSYANPVGNSGFNGFAAGTTTGLNVGGYSEAANGNVSIGQVGKSITSKTSATNIGVVGVARNTGGSSVEIGGYFGLNNSTPVFSSSALTADNGASSAPIFVGRDNGSEIFRIADGGNVGIGTTNPDYKLSVIVPSGDGIVVRSFSNTADDRPVISLDRNRGTEGSYSAVQSGDNLGEYGWAGSISSTSRVGSSIIRSTATQNWSPGTIGSKIQFFTVQNGTFTKVERLTISHDGLVGIGTTTPNAKLDVNGNTIVSGNLTVTGSNSSIAFSASNSLHWTGTTPATLQEALNRIAAAIYSGITGSIA